MDPPPIFVHTPESLLYAVLHVFAPSEWSVSTVIEQDSSLARAACAATHAYTTTHCDVDETSQPQWHRITRLLDNLNASVQSRHLERERVISQLREMQTGDNLAFFVRTRSFGILLTKRETCTIFETLEMPNVASSPLVCSYPGSAEEVSNHIFDDASFQLKLANFLAHRGTFHWGRPAPYVMSLHKDILPRTDHTANVPLIIKHIRVIEPPRSPLWHIIKVVIQMSLDRSPPGRGSYKAFMLFFMCTLASDANISTLCTDLLHPIACKIRRRLNKLGSFIPDWLSRMTLSTLEQLSTRSSPIPLPFRTPSQDELERDTRLSLTRSQEYIRNALANHNCEPPHTPFHPSHPRRGTIHDFLSSNGAFFEEAYYSDPEVTLWDVTKAVEEDLDDWIANVVDVDLACSQLHILMDKYRMAARHHDYKTGGVHIWSIILLTGVELFIALDKLLVKEIPMLANYSPEVPTAALENLVLQNQTSLHRLSRAYQYLSARESQSRLGWSALLDEDSLPVRYYDQSPHLQQLKARIEQDANSNDREQVPYFTRMHAEYADSSRTPLPASPLHAKVVVFELQCPSRIRIWRSAVARIWCHFSFDERFVDGVEEEKEKNLLSHTPVLQQYYFDGDEPLTTKLQFAYFYPPGSQNSPTLRYVARDGQVNRIWTWEGNEDPGRWDGWWRHCSYIYPNYARSTSLTPNDILASQAVCPADFSLDEYLACGQLRSGGLLQWLNILHGLHNKTLNIRRKDVYRLYSLAIYQVGPLDLNTGTWLWHEELQSSTFCNALLDELECLFADVGAQVIDEVMMHAISSLLTRVLASSPSEGIFQRTISFARRVRRKILDWIQELAYNLGKEPKNNSRQSQLLSMCQACLTTFNTDIATLSQHFQSEEDISAAISCILIMHGVQRRTDDGWSLYGHRLSIAFERVSSDLILSNVTDRGIDLAVRMVFPRFKPGARKWVKIQHPNTRWLTCQTRETIDEPSKTVHLNLLDGELRIDGRSISKLYYAIRKSWISTLVPPNESLFVLPQIDLSSLGLIPKQKGHFFFRGSHLIVWIQCNDSDSKDILEWIPSDILEHDLPPPLLDGHIHWLSLSRKLIEIRPRKRPLISSFENWRIDCASGQYRAYKGNENLVDIRSSTWSLVLNYFKCLNVVWDNSLYQNKALLKQASNLLMTASPIKSRSQPSLMLRLSVMLPSHGLSFFINEQGDLESSDFKDMVYDTNQQVETLSGIEQLFVLCQKADPDLPRGLLHRRILVPDGIPVTSYSDSGVSVRFNEGRERFDEPTYHIYDLDAELGCLTGNGSLKGTRQLAYMYAKTNLDGPDPFTGKTGREVAVSLLRSGGCRSIAKFRSLEKINSWISAYADVDMAHREIQERYYWKKKKVPGSPKAPPISTLRTEFSQITLFQVFSDRPAPVLPPRNNLPRVIHRIKSDCISGLNRLFRSLEMNKLCSSFHQKYIARLNASALHENSHVTYTLSGKDRTDVLKKHYVRCRASYFEALETLKERLCPNNDPHEQQWPPITGDNLLRCLASTSVQNLLDPWKRCLVSLALLLLDVQRARRLLRFALDGQEEEFCKELENEGCDGWNPEDYPDWLLIQIQGNFLIRPSQAEVAMEMISPKSGRNTVIQVNMGEGKSSVIIPIVAAVLADGNQLVRVVVPKALTVQMFDLLVCRLGGLVNRPVYHLPFSRTPEHEDFGRRINLRMNDMQQLLSQCMAERGLLLVQPEHILSLQLMCMEEQILNGKLVAESSSNIQASLFRHVRSSLLQKLVGKTSLWLNQSINDVGKNRDECSPGNHGPPNNWMSLQKWMDSHVRDILDESDEILHSRLQLMYTIGPAQHMEGFPDRWTITQQVLRLVNECARALAKNFPGSFQIESGSPGSFPFISSATGFDIGQRLKPLVIEYVMTGRIRNLDFHGLSQGLRDAICSFISDEDILPDTVKRVQEYAKYSDQACTWSALLLLRGILASNILLFALVERRWRVDYGLPSLPSRYGMSTDLAVPYRAKDLPAPNTHFGHPDITIILTCLSYYYSGLSERKLKTSFEILLDQDDPYTEYALWVKDHNDDTLPQSLQTLGKINLKSSEQWDNVLYPLFSRNQAAVDLYLSRVVFPKEAKEFPFKLCASNWDLARKREKVLKGFSGTDDCRWLLPMSVDQHDLDHQRGTSARVLEYLLRPENDFYITTTGENGERWTTNELLQVVAKQQPEIRVFLDVGAQILESSNHCMAKAWLDIVVDAAGAIYFNDRDELMVLMRNGESIPMMPSSLSQQLGHCVVYLDHAHTRGTDFKLPIGSRAAVTLGPRLTKDRLVQGCMRMRKLGRGHSVMFFAPSEVDMNIRTLLKKGPNTQITATDIVSWAIHETWTDIQQWAPYWAQHGMDYRSREDAWTRFCNKEITSKQLSDVWLQPATKSLEDLYAPWQSKKGLTGLDPDIQQRCKDLGLMSLSCIQTEEQEREVNREREREREEELLPKAQPAEHFLHPDVVAFVKTGILPVLHSHSAFRPIFTTLEKSSAATSEADVWSPSILATADFCDTIRPDSTKGTIDQYLRPVQWVVSSKRDQVLVLMSPFEVNKLIQEIKASEDIHLHMYAPRTSQRMKPSDDLKLYTIPPLPLDWRPPWELIDQLNLFAGQLYLRDYQSYLRLCRFLQVPTGESPDDAVVRRNLFKIPGSFKDEEITFSDSPLHSVMALLAIRRRGRPLSHTHMGKILYGQLLREQDFDELRLVVPRRSDIMYEKETPYNFEATPTSPMDLDPPESLPSYKRKLEMIETSGTSEPQSKRERSDR